ncbi:MAG: hypothetical protein WCK63_11720 [Betaproteobacteria bacterium]
MNTTSTLPTVTNDIADISFEEFPTNDTHYAIEMRATVTGTVTLVNDTAVDFFRDDGAVRPTAKHGDYEVTLIFEGPGIQTATRGYIKGGTVNAPDASTACVRVVKKLRRDHANQSGVINIRVGHIANLATGIEAELFAGEDGDLSNLAFARYVEMIDRPLSAKAMRKAERATGWRFGDYGTAQ